MKISGFEVKNSDCEILLGVKFNHKFNIHSRISYLCKKVSCKINAHRRVAPFAMDVFFQVTIKLLLLSRMDVSHTYKR